MEKDFLKELAALEDVMQRLSEDKNDAGSDIRYLKPYLGEAYEILGHGPKYPGKTALALPKFAEFYMRDERFSDMHYMYKLMFAFRELVAGAVAEVYIMNAASKTNDLGALVKFFGNIGPYAQKGMFLAKYSKAYALSNIPTAEYFRECEPKIKAELGLGADIASGLKSFFSEYGPRLVIYDVKEKSCPDGSRDITYLKARFS